ncbi:uncharacterized protein LOC118514163 [Anopheles stephensi]|uniref:uncharacterized protein LOC118514163 n=1 Tax=Anopheles stephensi TaxID=30069 RepID=UPI00165873EB|nr:uncharacterized protein LOC118514163 [Anopheles stephensi]
MMDERASTNSHQYETFLQRRRCWLVLGRTVLTISVLGLLTIGLYVGSNRVHLVSGEPVVASNDPRAPYVAIRERREAINGPETSTRWQPTFNDVQPTLKRRPQSRPGKKRTTKLPKKTNPASPNIYGNETTDYIYIDASGVEHPQHPHYHHPNLSTNGEIYRLEENVLQHHPNGGTTIESVLHVRRYKCFKHARDK